jgi:hypothetical protein
MIDESEYGLVACSIGNACAGRGTYKGRESETHREKNREKEKGRDGWMDGWMDGGKQR